MFLPDSNITSFMFYIHLWPIYWLCLAHNLYEVRWMREQTGAEASTLLGHPVTCLELGDGFSAIVNNPWFGRRKEKNTEVIQNGESPPTTVDSRLYRPE
jgi:hypothetical protein